MSNTLTIKNITIMLFFICLNLAAVFGLSQLVEGAGKTICQIFQVLSVIAFIVYYLQIKTYTIKNLLLMFLLVGYSAFSFVAIQRFPVFVVAMLILIMKDLPVKKALKYNNVTLLISLAIVVATSLVGITDIGAIEGVKSTGEEFAAYSFGFLHRNSFPLVVFAIIMGYNLLHTNNKFTKKEILFEVALTLFCMKASGSRTFGITMLIYIFLLSSIQKLVMIKGFRYILYPLQYLFVIGSIITIYIAVFYDPVDLEWYNFNIILATRPYLWHAFVNLYDINFFGNDITSFSSTTLSMPLDNAYLALLLYTGIGMLLLYNIIFVYISKLAYKMQRWDVLMTIIAYELYAFSETPILGGSLCNIILLFGYVVMNSSKESLKKKDNTNLVVNKNYSEV